MEICELFYSIQGEGILVGCPTVFVRASGCNLRCSYCDTRYAYEEPGIAMSIKEIIKQIKKHKTRYVCITGGEPLLQEETLYLIKKLLETDYLVSLETNGSIDISPLTKRFSKHGKSLLISLDIKCPSSRMSERMSFGNIKLLREHDQLKFVIGNKEDYEYAKSVMNRYNPRCTVLFQPVWNTGNKIAEWILKDELDVRLSLQIHKIVWGERRRV